MSLLKPARGIQLNRTHPLAKGLVGAWIFNERTGNMAFDLSGHGNDGTINGADWVPGGLDFVASSSDYVNLGTRQYVGTAKSFTVASKVRLDSFPGSPWSYPGILRTKAGQTQNWVLLFSEDVGYSDVSFGSENNFSRLRSGDIGITLGVEYDVTVVYNGNGALTASNYNLFIDGVNKTLSSASPFASDSSNSAIGVEGTNYWDGKIFYVYIYDRALQPSEVTSLSRDPYQMFQCGIDPGLFYHVTASGLTILDYERAIGRGMNRGIF